MKWSETLSFIKDPLEVLDYAWDFTQLLQSDAISTITVTGERLTIDSSSFSGKIVTIFVSGGTNGNTGKVTVKIVTTNSTPRTINKSFDIAIRDQ